MTTINTLCLCIRWEQFTDAVVKAVNAQSEHVVFMLWGKPAQVKGASVDRKKVCRALKSNART